MFGSSSWLCKEKSDVDSKKIDFTAWTHKDGPVKGSQTQILMQLTPRFRSTRWFGKGSPIDSDADTSAVDPVGLDQQDGFAKRSPIQILMRLTFRFGSANLFLSRASLMYQ